MNLVIMLWLTPPFYACLSLPALADHSMTTMLWDPLEAKCAFDSQRRHGPLTGDTCSCPRRPAHLHARHTVLIPGLEAYSSICIVLLAYDPSTESYQSDSKSPTDMLSKTRSCLQTSTISFRVNSHILITLCYVQLQPVFHNLYDLLPLSHAASTLISTS